MIFGSTRDTGTLLGIRQELISDVVAQEILYWKVDLQNTTSNIYGEAVRKGYWSPIRINCRIKRSDMTWNMDEFGPDLTRTFQFAFIKDDLVDCGVMVESGDIIEWHKDYFEVDSYNENQFFMGKDEDYRIADGTNGTEDETGRFGQSVSIVANTHMTRYSKLNITRQR